MHIGNKRPVPAVAAIILRDDEILLIKRASPPALGKWSAPGGSLEFGETLEEGVKREVKEETGLTIEVGEVAGVCDLIVPVDGKIGWHYVLVDYFATAKDGEPTAATDAAECKWVRLSEIGEYDVTGSLLSLLRRHNLIK